VRPVTNSLSSTMGGIIGAGNRHLRHLLIEAVWHYRHEPQVGRALRLSRRCQPPEVIARAANRLIRRLEALGLKVQVQTAA
jgi:hypothetical protein